MSEVDTVKGYRALAKEMRRAAGLHDSDTDRRITSWDARAWATEVEALQAANAIAVEALRALVEASEQFFAPKSMGAPVWPRTVEARKLLDRLGGQSS